MLAGPRLYQVVRGRWTWLAHEVKTRTSAPLAVRTRAWPRGFFAESALIYDAALRDMGEYVSDYRQLQTSAWCNLWDGLLTHRLFVRSHLRALGCPHVDPLAYLYDGRILLHPLRREAQPIDRPQLDRELLDVGVDVVLGPEDSRHGRARTLIQSRDGLLVRRDTRGPGWLEAGDLAGPLLIDRRLALAGFWRDLYPEATNTVRLLTL